MISVPRPVRRLARQFRQAGHELYVVGGAVRDALLNRPVTDYDFATSATPEEVQTLFHRTIPTGIRHGTVTVLFHGAQFEVTTYRVDGGYSDHRHPDAVTFTRTLREDLARRDFTVNAIALDPETGTIHDPFDGRRDLSAGVIRTVGDPDARFGEDALRMLRAIRFATVLGFSVDHATEAAISRHHHTIGEIAAERILQELRKMMAADSPSRGWRLMRTTGLLSVVGAELLEGDMPPDGAEAVPGLFDHLVAACDCAPAGSEVLRWAALLHDIGKPRCAGVDERGRHFHGHDAESSRMARVFLERLRAPRGLTDAVSHLVAHHMFGVSGESTDAAIRRFVARVGRDAARELVRLRRADICGKTGRLPSDPALGRLEDRVAALESEDAALTVRDLAVGGRELMNELNIPPGPTVGIILRELLETVLDDPALNTRENLLEIARRFAAERLDTPE